MIETFQFRFPAGNEPSWKEKVERWYQLDPFSYGLCEALHTWQQQPLPNAIVLASPGASNFMDRQFVEGGATSPAKFVYTLPNVRGAPLCQLLQWHGPVWCLQKDPYTLYTALQEALVWRRKYPLIWVMGAMESPATNGFLAFRIVCSDSSVRNLELKSDNELLGEIKLKDS